MNVFSRAALLAAACACASLGAQAIDVVTGIGLNYKNMDMSFEQDIRVRPVSGSNALLDGRINQDISFDTWQPVLQASVAAVVDDYYLVLNGETDVLDEGTNIKVDQQRSEGLAVNVADPYVDKDVDVSRDDLGITVGWRGTDRIALFVGYKYGKTVFGGDAIAREFIASGPLLGASYSVPFDTGVLTLGGAFARMSGSYDEDGSAALLAEEVEGDADGFSTFINWSAPLTDRLRYLIDLRWQRYDFDGSDLSVCSNCTNQLINPPLPMYVNKDFSVQETLYGLGLGIVYAL